MNSKNIQTPQGGRKMPQAEVCPRFFEDILQSNLFGIAIATLDGKVILNNTYFHELLSVDTADNIYDVIAASGNNTSVTQNIRSFLHDAEVNTSKNVTVSCGAKRFQLYVTCSESQQGEKHGIFLTQDVSDRYRFLSEIRKARNLYKSFADTAFEIIIRCSESGKLISFNRLFVKALEYPSYLSARRNTIDEILDCDFESIKDQLIGEEEVVQKQVWLKKQNGGMLRGLANISMEKNSSAEKVYNWVVLDLTQYTEYEEYLRSVNNKLRKVSFQLEKFLYSTSHDLRSPLTSILGLVNLIRSEAGGTHTAEYANMIESSAKRLDGVIKNLAYLSRVNYYESRNERVVLSKLVDKVIQGYEYDLASKKIKFEIMATETNNFYSDEEKLRIVFDQLIRNSITFYDSNKIVPMVQIKIRTESDHVVIEIFDNGIGIDSKHINSVFNMFFKGSMNSSGSGLGLFIVKEALDNLQGTISMGSQLGVGSWVTIEIPNGRSQFSIPEREYINNIQQDVA